MSEERTIAHNALLDAMTACGISYQDRAHAARIAGEILDNPGIFDIFAERMPRTRFTIVEPTDDRLFFTAKDALRDIAATLGQEGCYEAVSVEQVTVYRVKDTQFYLLEQPVAEENRA